MTLNSDSDFDGLIDILANHAGRQQPPRNDDRCGHPIGGLILLTWSTDLTQTNRRYERISHQADIAAAVRI